MNTEQPTFEECATVPSTAVAIRDTRQAVEALDASATPAKTSQDLRVLEVSEALVPAYQKASTLELTPEECEKLMAPFPDECIEIRPHDGLIFIPHILVSDRLNRIFGPGKWALIRRREWFDENSKTMYGEYILLIRGCYVGESTGGHPYVPNNPKTNLSDALESTAAEALRRIAGKRLSCGSQVWNPEYARQWCRKYSRQSQGKYFKLAPEDAEKGQKPAAKAPTSAPPPASPPKQAAPTPEAREAFLAMFKDEQIMDARAFFVAVSAIMDTEGLEDVPMSFLPASDAQRQALTRAIGDFIETGDARLPYPRNEGSSVGGPPLTAAPAKKAAPATDEPWRTFVMPFGARRGQELGKLDKKYLFGLWANFTVEQEYQGRPRKAEQIATDTQLREMLDAAGKHYAFEL